MTKEWASTSIFYGVPLEPSCSFFSNLKSLKHENTRERRRKHEYTKPRKLENAKAKTPLCTLYDEHRKIKLIKKKEL